MSKLLYAGLSRLVREKILWIGVLATAAVPLTSCFTRWKDMMEYNVQSKVEEMLFIPTVIIGAVCAAFCSLFVGTEYSDGTIRNKLIVGHKRNSIYFSNLVLVFTATLFMESVAFLLTLGIGCAIFGPPELSTGALLQLVGVSIMLTAQFSALFTMLCLRCQNKALAAVICLLTFFIMMMASTMIYSALDQPEMITGYTLSVNNEVVESEPSPNPNYVRGVKRQIYTLLNEFLPTGQVISVVSLRVTHPLRLSIWSALLAVICTLGGYWGFRKQDIK